MSVNPADIVRLGRTGTEWATIADELGIGIHRIGGLWSQHAGEDDRTARHAARHPAPVLRPCGHCKRTMPLRDGESAGQYAIRHYCDRTCQIAGQRGRQTGRRHEIADFRRVGERLSPAEERDAIERFIAERGVSPVKPAFCAPSIQGARPEAEAARLIAAKTIVKPVGIREVCRFLHQSGHRAGWAPSASIDGRQCSRGDLYRAANRLRSERGLDPYPVPSGIPGT